MVLMGRERKMVQSTAEDAESDLGTDEVNIMTIQTPSSAQQRGSFLSKLTKLTKRWAFCDYEQFHSFKPQCSF